MLSSSSGEGSGSGSDFDSDSDHDGSGSNAVTTTADLINCIGRCRSNGYDDIEEQNWDLLQSQALSIRSSQILSSPTGCGGDVFRGVDGWRKYKVIESSSTPPRVRAGFLLRVLRVILLGFSIKYYFPQSMKKERAKKKLLSMSDVARFLETHPEYVKQGIDALQFSFKVPNLPTTDARDHKMIILSLTSQGRGGDVFRRVGGCRKCNFETHLGRENLSWGYYRKVIEASSTPTSRCWFLLHMLVVILLGFIEMHLICTPAPHNPYKLKKNVVTCQDLLCSSLNRATYLHCQAPQEQCDYQVDYADSGPSGCGYNQEIHDSTNLPYTDEVLGVGLGKSIILEF